MKKFLMIIGGIVVGAIVIGVAIFVFVSVTSNKLVCKSTNSNITIMYNDSKITGYTAKGMTYDLDAQSDYAKTTGIDSYIKEFKTWFAENTDGSCETK